MSFWSASWADIVNAASSATQAILFNNQNIGGFKNAYFQNWGTQTISGNATVDLTLNQNFTLTISATATVTLATPPGPCKGIIIIQNGGAYTTTLAVASGTIQKKNSGYAISAVNGVETMVAYVFDGTNWRLVSTAMA